VQRSVLSANLFFPRTFRQQHLFPNNTDEILVPVARGVSGQLANALTGGFVVRRLRVFDGTYRGSLRNELLVGRSGSSSLSCTTASATTIGF
jgi:hypothetical protein